MNPVGLLYTFAAIALVISGQLLLKMGMSSVGEIGRAQLKEPFRLLRNVSREWRVVVGLTLYVASAALWILALATVPLSVAYPMLGVSYVAIALVSVVVLGEWLSPAQWLGLASVVLGVILVATS